MDCCCYCGGYFEEGFYIQDELAKYCSEDCLFDSQNHLEVQNHLEFEEYEHVLENKKCHSKAS